MRAEITPINILNDNKIINKLHELCCLLIADNGVLFHGMICVSNLE